MGDTIRAPFDQARYDAAKEELAHAFRGAVDIEDNELEIGENEFTMVLTSQAPGLATSTVALFIPGCSVEDSCGMKCAYEHDAAPAQAALFRHNLINKLG